MMLLARPGESVPLVLVAEDGATDLFPRARVYSEGGTFVQNVDLSHVANGLYMVNYTLPAVALKYVILFTVYADAGHSIVDETHGQADGIIDAESLDQILGADEPIVPSSR